MRTYTHVLPTQYEGYRFRSRLEARWAVFFKTLGISFDYEPEGFDTFAGNYLPDFFLPEFDAFAEVKPTAFEPIERAKVMGLVDRARRPVILLAGPPEYAWYEIVGSHSGLDPECVCFWDSKCKGRLWFGYGEEIPARDPRWTPAPYARAVEASRAARFGR